MDPLNESPEGVRFFYKHLMAAIILLGLSIGLTVVLNTGLKFMEKDYHVPFIVLEHVATALTIGGLWHIIHELLIKRDLIKLNNSIVEKFLRTTVGHRDKIVNGIESLKSEVKTNKQEILQHVQQAKRDAKLGLIDTFHDVAGFSFSEFIAHPAELTIVLGDGYTWISSHIETLRERISDKKKVTKIFLINPAAPAMAVVAGKMHVDEKVFRDRALATVQILEAEIAPSGNLTVFGHNSVPHHSLYLGDRLAITPYYFSKTRRNPPVFIFEKGTYVAKVQADLKDLEAESVILLGGPAQLGKRGPGHLGAATPLSQAVFTPTRPASPAPGSSTR